MDTEHIDPAPEAVHDDEQRTPEQLMQAATARIAELEAERDEMRDKWMRSEAEMANLRARTKREIDETRQYAVQKFARDVTEAADNVKRGLDSLPQAGADEPPVVAKLREGFEGVERSFTALLERNGIKREDPTGAVFDPQPAPGDGRAGQRRASGRHRDPGLDPGLDAERQAAPSGDGGGGQGRRRPGGQGRHHRLTCRLHNKRACRSCRQGGCAEYILTTTVGVGAVPRAARIR